MSICEGVGWGGVFELGLTGAGMAEQRMHLPTYVQRHLQRRMISRTGCRVPLMTSCSRPPPLAELHAPTVRRRAAPRPARTLYASCSAADGIDYPVAPEALLWATLPELLSYYNRKPTEEQVGGSPACVRTQLPARPCLRPCHKARPVRCQLTAPWPTGCHGPPSHPPTFGLCTTCTGRPAGVARGAGRRGGAAGAGEPQQAVRPGADQRLAAARGRQVGGRAVHA